VRHVPHLYLAGPWERSVLPIEDAARRHLEKVLRLREGSPVSYTDGAGASGRGLLTPAGIERGDERHVDRPGGTLTLAVAPPKAVARQRFIVEKLAELGVDRLVWIDTVHGEGRAPRDSKARAWAVAALEQSRGTYLMLVDGPVLPKQAAPGATCLVADPDGSRLDAHRTGRATALFVGPEGGFAAGELPSPWPRITLGDGILRTDTAAVVGAAAVARWVR
jgi:16S rRNA (uracil1498-N3)-methyltransferase